MSPSVGVGPNAPPPLAHLLPGAGGLPQLPQGGPQECTAQQAQCSAYFMFISTQLAELKATMEHMSADQRLMATSLNVVAVWQARQEEKNQQQEREIAGLKATVAECIEKRVLWAFGVGVAFVSALGTGTLMQFLHLAK